MAQRDPLDSLDSRLDAVQRRIRERFDERAEELEAAAAAVRAGDTNALARLRAIAHKLKGHSSDPALGLAAETIENAADAQDAAGALAAVPAMVTAARSVASRSRSTPWPPMKVPTGPGRILVVDDDPTIRQVVALTLARLGGYEVVVAANVDEASALCESRSFDLAIIDRRLPGTDGLEFAQGVASRGGVDRTVIYSGSGQKSHERDLAIDDWWEKPMNAADLTDAVRAILARPPRKSAPAKGS